MPIASPEQFMVEIIESSGGLQLELSCPEVTQHRVGVIFGGLEVLRCNARTSVRRQRRVRGAETDSIGAR